MAQLFQNDPEHVNSVLGNDLNKLQELLRERHHQKSDLRRQQQEELKGIDENWVAALEHNPEAFARVVFDEDIGQDEIGNGKANFNELEAETEKELDLRLQPSLDMLKIKDKKDRGTLTIKVLYHEFAKEEQLAALEEER